MSGAAGAASKKVGTVVGKVGRVCFTTAPYEA